MKPVQRGGAGGVDRLTSGTTAGPASAHRIVSRLAWAVSWPPAAKSRRKRAAAVADHIDAHRGAFVADEWHDGGRLWLSVVVHPPITLAEASRMAEGCPEYVPGTFKVLG